MLHSINSNTNSNSNSNDNATFRKHASLRPATPRTAPQVHAPHFSLDEHSSWRSNDNNNNDDATGSSSSSSSNNNNT